MTALKNYADILKDTPPIMNFYGLESPDNEVTELLLKIKEKELMGGDIYEDPWDTTPWKGNTPHRIRHDLPADIKYGDVVTVDTHALTDNKFPEGTLEQYVVCKLIETATACRNDRGEMVVSNCSGMVAFLLKAEPCQGLPFNPYVVYGPISTAYMLESMHYTAKSSQEHFDDLRRFGPMPRFNPNNPPGQQLLD